MLRKTIGLLALILLLAAAFALGAAVERGELLTGPARAGGVPPSPPVGHWRPHGPMRGTIGAIDQIEGDVIRMLDARNGSVLYVRTGDDTVIELGRRGRIPLRDLRVGQRIFVVGNPASSEMTGEFDARFIGVLLGQPQKYMRPVQPAVCVGCTD